MRFLVTPLPSLPQASDQRFLHFMHFLLCGKAALTQGQSLQVGKLKSFHLRKERCYFRYRWCASLVTVQFSPSTTFIIIFFVGGTSHYLAWTRITERVTCLWRKCQATSSGSRPLEPRELCWFTPSGGWLLPLFVLQETPRCQRYF